MNMNQEIILSETQSANRAVLGYRIYNSGQIERIGLRLFKVSDKYMVEDLTTDEDIEPIFMCSCPDFNFRGVRHCKHVIAIQFYIMGL